MRYENYRNKMQKLAGFAGAVRRFRVPIILALALVAAVCAALLSVRGIVYEVTPCPSSVEYGSPLGYEAAAVLADVRYEYAPGSGGEWTCEVPVRVGEYRVRAVAENAFGGRRCGSTRTFSIVPRETDVYVSQEKAEYGSLPAVTADLAYGDTVFCTRFEYADIAAAETEVTAVESAIVALDREGNDVSFCYIFRPVAVPLGFTPREISVRVQDAESVYDGTPLRFDGYELDPSTPLAEGDILIAQFDDERTEAGEGENIPEIRVKNTATGKDVTARYKIGIVPGKLTVQKRPLYVTTGSASKIYDGTALADGRYSLAAADGESGLLEGHREVLLSGTRLTDAGSADNILQFRIENGDGADVSANYSLFFDAGTLSVGKRQVFYSTGSGAWEYDGTAHSCTEYSVADGGENTGILPGHTHAPGTPAEITDAGEAENASALCITDAEGRDVTSNYETVCRAGTLSVVPRPVTLRSENGEWVYDGEAHSQPLLSVAEGSRPLVAGHAFRIGQCAEITDAGSVQNLLGVFISAADGKDVTANYDITCEYGVLTVLPRPVTVRAADAEKVYDGTALRSDGFIVTSEYDPALVAGHTCTAKTEGIRTDAGEEANRVVSFSVRDAEGKDVTANYGVTFAEGVLTVLPRPVTVRAADAEKVYDGTALRSDGFIVTSEYDPALVAGHTCAADTEGDRTDAGTAENRISRVIIYDADGRDVTANYAVTEETGVLKVLPRPVVFRTADNAWMYDGTEHSESGFVLAPSSGYKLVAGHKAVAEKYAVVDAGEYENRLTVRIVSQDEEEVTFNYDISYEYGTLSVHPRPITVTAADAEKMYDGLPLESTDVIITSDCDPALVEGHYYDFYNAGTRTDAGQSVCTVEYFCVYEGDFAGGVRDVTDNYEITFGDGTLSVTRRPITVKAANQGKVYDGLPLESDAAVWVDSDLISWHSYDVETQGSITDAGTAPCSVRSVTVWEYGRDVTFNYEITCLGGTLIVTPLPIGLQAGSASKKFDGTPLTCETFLWIPLYEDRLPVEGQTARVLTQGEQTEIGKSSNKVVSYALYEGMRDVTGNYAVTCFDGCLRVLIPDYTMKISTGSGSKVYDGTPLTVPECEITESDLPDTFSVTAEAKGSAWAAGKVRNTVRLEIIAPDGTDVSDFIYVEYDYGILEILPRPIIVQTASNSWEYDGETHWDTGAETTAASLPLAEGDSFQCTGPVFISRVGIEENSLEMEIVRQVSEGVSVTVTDCYIITWIYGVLEITPSDLYGDIGIGLPDIAPGGGDGGGDGSGSVGSFGKVYSESGGMVYLREANYGEYMGAYWRSTIPYKQLLDDTYSMNYLASFALQDGGKQGSLIRIQMETGKYVLPYYMVPGAGNYQVQTSDVLYSGNTSEPYELYNYFYDYAAEGGFGELPAQYAAAEAAYRNFVRNEYLAVPETTQSYLKYVIRRQGFDASDPSVISKVANYVQGAAQYNWKYDRLLDVQSDIVVAFLRDFKEGICQHYASAATLLFRMLGFPARYTVGYAVKAEAGEWTDISELDAHAWVEVYIDGFGWVYVEVTGAGHAFGDPVGGNEPLRLKIKPADEVKQYDGTPLTARYVEGADPRSALLLRELLHAGYSYKAVFGGSITPVGWSMSSIESFTLFDAGGTDVTNRYDFEFTRGELAVVEETVITVRPYALQKQYDGEPFLYGAYDYTAAGVPGGHALHLSLEGIGLTDAGVLRQEDLQGVAVSVTDEYGRDVTDRFYIHFDLENALMVSRRAITVASISETKAYDGTPLTNRTFWIAGGSLAPGNVLFAEVIGSQTEIGSSENSISSVRITDAAGAEVTDNYRVSLSEGMLTVLG